MHSGLDPHGLDSVRVEDLRVQPIESVNLQGIGLGCTLHPFALLVIEYREREQYGRTPVEVVSHQIPNRWLGPFLPRQ